MDIVIQVKVSGEWTYIQESDLFGHLLLSKNLNEKVIFFRTKEEAEKVWQMLGITQEDTLPLAEDEDVYLHPEDYRIVALVPTPI